MSAARRGNVARSAVFAPKVVIPVFGLLAAALLGLGVAYAMKDGGQVLNLSTCAVGEEGCELRAAVHYHADFAVFIDGEQYDFDRAEFISTEGNDRSPTAHIHEPRTTVVHVHRSNTTWWEFFDGLGFSISDKTVLAGTGPNTFKLPDGTTLEETDGKTFKYYVNGVRVDGVAMKNIADLDRVLVSYGDETPEEVVATQLPQVTDQACIPSGRCADRIPADEPPEICSNGNECTILEIRKDERRSA